MKKIRLRRLFADHFLLKVALVVNLVHFSAMLISAFASRLDYRYFAIHFNTPGGIWDLLRFFVLFLLPSILAVAFVFLLRAVDRKPKPVRTAAQAVCTIAMLAAMAYTVVLTFIFQPSMPFASYTRNPDHIFDYDQMVMQSLPTSNCPDLTREIPEGAENVEFSYWYIHIMDDEWKISVSYDLPEETYRQLRDAAIAQLEAMEGLSVTETETGTTYDTVDYRQNLGRAWTHLVFSYDDESGHISYLLDCFYYSRW